MSEKTKAARRPYCPPEWRLHSRVESAPKKAKPLRPAGHRRRWTAEEREQLRTELASGIDWETIAEKHERQLDAVRMQASLMGCKLAPGVQTAPWQKAKERLARRIKNARQPSGG